MPLSKPLHGTVAPPNETIVDSQFKGKNQILDENNSTGSAVTNTSVLKASVDKYEGVIVDASSMPADIPTFVDSLNASLADWKLKNLKGVWLKLPTANANLVIPAIEAGFRYHHAEPAYVMLVKWLPDTPSTLPANATHQVGIGAFVINDKQEILAVQEKSGTFKGTGVWKMPTGVVLQGEDVFAGAIREVKEETGVDAEFVEVIGFRQAHGVAFGKSDLFFLCVLRPLSSEIVKSDTEIAAAKWMPLAEFRSQAYLKERRLLGRMLEVCIATVERGYKGFTVEDMKTGSQRKPSYFYYNNAGFQDSM